MRLLTRSLILASISFCSLILIVAAILFLTPQKVSHVQLVPEDCVAYFQNMKTSDVVRWYPLYPELRTLPAIQAPSDIAIVELQGKRQWILFSDEGQEVVKGIHFTASTPAASALVRTHPKSLSRLPAFRDIQPQNASTSPTLYFNLQKNDPWVSPSVLDSFIKKGVTHIALTLKGTGATLSLFSATPDVWNTFGSERTDAVEHLLSPAPHFSLSLSSPTTTIDAFLKAHPSQNAIVEGRLGILIKNVLGEDVSLRYDLFPLLQKPSTLHARIDQGSFTFLLMGQAQGSAVLSATLKRIEESAAATFASASEIRREYDQKQVGSSLQFDTEQVERTEETHAGWTVHSIKEKNGDHFFAIARKGNRFLLTTRPEWLSQIVTGDGSSRPVLPLSVPLRASGMIDSSILPLETLPLSRFFPLPLSGRYRWSFGTTDTVASITVEEE